METLEETNPETIRWSSLKKFMFLFIFFYSFLYIFPSPLDEIPGVEVVFKYYTKIPDALTMFVGNHLLHISNFHKIEETGSGDTTFDYVRVLTIFMLSIILVSILFIVGRKKPNYSKLFYLLYVSVRYYLALYMIIYGFAKIFKSQFVSPSLFILMERYGNSSPMGLLWNFMGYSTAYTVFAGIGEALGGILLLFRRTTIIGAFLSLVVMANVAAMNFCYDVPVKLFSLHLVLFSIFILTPHARNLYIFLIHRKNAVLEDFAMPFKARWIKITRIILKLIIFLIVGVMAYTSYTEMKQYGDSAPIPPMYGMYKTQLFVRNHDTLKPLTTDTMRWNRMIIDKYATRFDLMTERQVWGQMKVDTIKRIMDFKSYMDTANINHFAYTLKMDTLIMRGNWKKDSLYIRLKRMNLKQFLLVNRGFHWINEYPFNQ